jgi:GT2 family glycosyltransferase
MEDYELNQRLRKLGRVATARAAAITRDGAGKAWAL